MSLVNSVLPVTNAKDSRWLTLEVCREYQRNKCSRTENECKFAHPPAHVEVNNGRVVCCFDSLKNRCNRTDPPCKYLHPPPHLRDQLLQNGRNNLILKNIQMGMLQQALLHQSGLLPLGPYVPLAATAPNLPQHPYVGGGASPFLGGASPIPLLSPAPGGDPGLLTAASPAAAAAAGLTPVVPNNLMGAQAMKLPVSAPTTFSLVHPTSASPSATNMFGNAPSPHASFVAAAAAAAANQQAKLMQDRCKGDRLDGMPMGQSPYAGLQAKSRPNGETNVGQAAENGIASSVSGQQASLLAAAAVVSMNSPSTALQQAMGAAGFQQSGATPPAAALATMQLPTGQQAYIPAHPGPGDFATFQPSAGHPSTIHRF